MPKPNAAKSARVGGVLDPWVAPLMLVDYVWVIAFYGAAAFWLAVLIDGHLLPAYDQATTDRTSSPVLFLQIILQVALQGFLAMMIHTLLNKLPSPVSGVGRYSSSSPEFAIVRNPAVISVILFALSKSLQGRLMSLFRRFDKN